MRHWWTIPAAAFLFVLPALACGGGTPTAAVQRGGAATQPAATTAAQPAPAKVGDTVTHNGVAVTLHAVEDPSPPGQTFKPAAGSRWVALDVTIKDVDTKEHPYNPLYAKLKTADNREANTTIGGKEPGMKSGTLAAGEAARGWLTFELPQDAQAASFEYAPIDFSGTRIVFALR
jgi:hypothetical protein